MRAWLLLLLGAIALAGCAQPPLLPHAATTAAPAPKPYTHWVPIVESDAFEALAAGGQCDLPLLEGPAGQSHYNEFYRNDHLLTNDTLQVEANLTVYGVQAGSGYELGWRIDGGAINWTAPYGEGDHTIAIPFKPAQAEQDGPRWEFFLHWVGTDPTQCGGVESGTLTVLVEALQPWDGVLPETPAWQLLMDHDVGGRIPEVPVCAVATGATGHEHPLSRGSPLITAQVHRIVANVTMAGTWTGWQFGHSLDQGPMQWSPTFQSGKHQVEIPLLPGQKETRSLRWSFAWRAAIDPATGTCPGGGPVGGGDARVEVYAVK